MHAARLRPHLAMNYVWPSGSPAHWGWRSPSFSWASLCSEGRRLSKGGRQHSLSLLQGLDPLLVADFSVPRMPISQNQGLGSAQEHNDDDDDNIAATSITTIMLMVPAGLYCTFLTGQTHLTDN